MNKIIKRFKKTNCLFIAILMLLNIFIFSGANIFADTDNPKLALQISSSTADIDEEDKTKLIYSQNNIVVGTVKVRCGEDYVTPVIHSGNVEFNLPECEGDGYQILVEVAPQKGYGRSSEYFLNGTEKPFPGDNIINLAITDNNIQNMSFEFNPNNEISDFNGQGQVRVTKMDFTINGESFTDVEFNDINKTINVAENFNMDELTEFYVTKIELNDGTVFLYEPDEYSLRLLDSENRRIFESHFDKISDNMARFRVEAHSGDILDSDIASGKTRDDYFHFYITNIDFIKNGLKGVKVSTDVMPDNYDFTLWNGVDLSSTTEFNPGNVTVYYGENTISFQSIVSSDIFEINLVDDGTVPNEAVEINNSLKQVKVLSNYYNVIPLKIKLEDETIGYINVSRIGMFISDLNPGSDTLYHGASAMISGNFNVDTDKNRIAATFYHEDTKTFKDYDLIVNMTYTDGSTETTIAEGIGDVHNSYGNIVGSDYLLWKDDSKKIPSKVFVTAIKKNALENANAFGGATFGSGSGIEWNYRR